MEDLWNTLIREFMAKWVFPMPGIPIGNTKIIYVFLSVTGTGTGTGTGTSATYGVLTVYTGLTTLSSTFFERFESFDFFEDVYCEGFS